jgi:hypothetical protein
MSSGNVHMLFGLLFLWPSGLPPFFLSDVYRQEMGVPQGSILSVTLFILKINRIVECLPPGLRSSLYVDDFVNRKTVAVVSQQATKLG